VHLPEEPETRQGSSESAADLVLDPEELPRLTMWMARLADLMAETVRRPMAELAKVTAPEHSEKPVALCSPELAAEAVVIMNRMTASFLAPEEPEELAEAVTVETGTTGRQQEPMEPEAAVVVRTAATLARAVVLDT